jgi:hypothetical protein
MTEIYSSQKQLGVRTDVWRLLAMDSNCIYRGTEDDDEMTQDGTNHYLPKEGE